MCDNTWMSKGGTAKERSWKRRTVKGLKGCFNDRWALLWALAALLLTSPLYARAAEKEAHILQVLSLSDTPPRAWIGEPSEGSKRRLVEEGDVLPPDTLLETDSDTWVSLLFLPACKVWVSPETLVRIGSIGPPGEEETTVLHLLEGWLRAQLTDLGLGHQPFMVEAESVLASPEGTDFTVGRDRKRVVISVFAGTVVVSTPDGEKQWLVPGQTIVKQHEGELGRPEAITPGKEGMVGVPENGEILMLPDIQFRREGVGLELPSPDLTPGLLFEDGNTASDGTASQAGSDQASEGVGQEAEGQEGAEEGSGEGTSDDGGHATPGDNRGPEGWRPGDHKPGMGGSRPGPGEAGEDEVPPAGHEGAGPGSSEQPPPDELGELDDPENGTDSMLPPVLLPGGPFWVRIDQGY